MKTITTLVVLGVAMAIVSILIWSTVQITIYQFKASCEPLMSADRTSQWLECDKQPTVDGQFDYSSN